MLAEKIDACYARIQSLEIVATRKNLEILTQTLYDLQDVYNELKRKGADDAADHE